MYSTPILYIIRIQEEDNSIKINNQENLFGKFFYFQLVNINKNIEVKIDLIVINISLLYLFLMAPKL